jgi:hypothetical protein
MKDTSQTDAILNYMLSGGKLTPIDALKKFNCFRLGARIFNIKQLGKYAVKTEIISKKGKRFAQYSIEI